MRSLFLALSFIALVVPASAQSARGNRDLKTYCSGDAATFCSGEDPGSPEMNACFKKNMKRLSENCRRAIKAYKGGGRR